MAVLLFLLHLRVMASVKPFYIALVIWAVLSSVSCSQQPTSLVVLETTDIHGVIDGNMASLASLIRQEQAQRPTGTLLLDCGDHFQGSSEIFFSNYVDTTNTHVFVDIFNYLHYDAVALGNHDFEVGPAIYRHAYAQADMPVLCANIVYKNTGKPIFEPYHIIKKDGYKIAVLGLVTIYALQWIPEEDMEDVSFQSVEKAAAYWTQVIAKKEKPDVLIGLIHSGPGSPEPELDAYGDEVSLSSTIGRENAAAWVGKTIPGFDLICCGHSHQVYTGSVVNVLGDTVHLMSAGTQATHLAKATLNITPVPKQKPRISITTELLAANTAKADTSFLAHVQPFLDRSSAYFNSPVCNLEQTIYSRDALNGPSAWVDMLHEVYLSLGKTQAANVGVDVSFAAAYKDNARLEKGPLTVKDFITFYPYENTLSIVEMTGTEIMDYMEYSYNLRLEDPNGPVYDFDSVGGFLGSGDEEVSTGASGIIYKVHIDKPYGERIEIVGMSNGNKFFTERRYHVAMTTFRAMGGGGHLSKGLGWTKEKMKARRLWESEEDIRPLIIEHFAAKKDLLPTPSHNWSYVGPTELLPVRTYNSSSSLSVVQMATRRFYAVPYYFSKE